MVILSCVMTSKLGMHARWNGVGLEFTRTIADIW